MPTSASNSDQPALAIIANSITPYRLHLHRRIVREVPEVRLISIFTHDISNSPWLSQSGADIAPVMFGPGEPSELQARPSKAFHEWRKGGRINEFLAEQNVRLAIVNGYNDLGRLRIIYRCRQHRLPCLVFGDSNIRSEQATGLAALFKQFYLRRIIRWSDGVLPCGSLGAEFFAKYGAAPDRITYMPYEPDYEMIRGITGEQIDSAQRRFGLDRSRRRIVFSGRLVDMKRVDLLIDAFISIASARPDWDLLIIGDGPLRAELEARLPVELKPRVKWTGFLDDQPTVSALYRLCDVLVLSSGHEPWAVVINEAAAAGLAIVSSDVVGAAAELVRDGVNGRTFPTRNLEKLKECLMDVTDSAHTDSMKRASAAVLADWQERGDPIKGLRQVLRKFGAIQ